VIISLRHLPNSSGHICCNISTAHWYAIVLSYFGTGRFLSRHSLYLPVNVGKTKITNLWNRIVNADNRSANNNLFFRSSYYRVYKGPKLRSTGSRLSTCHWPRCLSKILVSTVLSSILRSPRYSAFFRYFPTNSFPVFLISHLLATFVACLILL